MYKLISNSHGGIQLSQKRCLLLIVTAFAFALVFILAANDTYYGGSVLQLDPRPALLLSIQTSTSSTGIANSHTEPATTLLPKSLMTSLQKLHAERADRVRNVCLTLHLNGTFSSTGGVRLVYAPKYNIGYYDIPKIGSTFMKQMFMILTHGPGEADAVFAKKRESVHTTGGLYKKVVGDTLKKTLTMVTSRNPYTRLYSAYVDKVFLPLATSLSSAVSRYETSKHNSCGTDDSFSAFLTYALREHTSRSYLDHYQSAYKMESNFVCKLEKFMVVKQETFADDIEYALQESGVEYSTASVISAALHDHRVEATIPGIVRTIYSKSKSISHSCWPWRLIAKRTWTSFQIQGYIDNAIAFPEDKFNENQYADPTYLINVILETIAAHPLTSEQSKAQRRQALIDAYSQVSNTLKDKIKTLYAMDFKIYEYDLDLNAI